MKVQKHAISLACLAALGFAGSAQAVQVAGEALEVYGNAYPQYQVTTPSDASTGTRSTMTGPNTTQVSKTQLNWVNSYAGFKGQKAFGDVSAGFDLQAVLMKNGTLGTESNELGEARDAFLFIKKSNLGTLQVGQMDTILKEFGDRVRILGISSSNITSTSGMVLGPTFRSGGSNSASQGTNTTTTQGLVTFNTRINGQLRWVSPNWAGVEVGVSYRPDPNRTATQNASLTSYGVRWSNPTYYVGLAQETHNDWKGVSGTAGAGAFYNATTDTSKDTASRLSFGYTQGNLRMGADVARLEYNEDATVTGRFTNYTNTNWQVSAEYQVTPQIAVAANYAVNGAGTCTQLNVTTCSTDGLGGSLLSGGVRYDFDKSVGVYFIYAINNLNSSAITQSGSGTQASNIGGNVTNAAVGLNVKF